MESNLQSNENIDNINIRSTVFELSKNKLCISFYITGKIDDYIFPSKSDEKRANELWKSTCFELFLANSKKEEYYELNFSSSLAWNFYYLNTYRANVKEVGNVSKPQIEVYKNNDEFKITCELELENLEEFDICNVACIVVNTKNERTFWSLNHQSEVADFHERKNFFEIT